jgi:hypothetical protein
MDYEDFKSLIRRIPKGHVPTELIPMPVDYKLN